MNATIPECPLCRVRMEEGFVLHMKTSERLHRQSWIEGPPETGVLMGYKIKGKRRIETVTYRCPRCGWLVWFAPEPGTG